MKMKTDFNVSVVKNITF